MDCLANTIISFWSLKPNGSGESRFCETLKSALQWRTSRWDDISYFRFQRYSWLSFDSGSRKTKNKWLLNVTRRWMRVF